MELNRRGIGSVEVVTEQFAALARSVIRANRMSESKMVVIPANPEFVTQEELGRLADDALQDIIEKLQTG